MFPPSELDFLSLFLDRGVGGCASGWLEFEKSKFLGDSAGVIAPGLTAGCGAKCSSGAVPLLRGFMAGTGGGIMASTGGPPSFGRYTRGTVDVLETNVGSEIMFLVTDFLREPEGVARPGIAVGVILPLVAGFGEGSADDGGDIGIPD